jgi:mannobiose 2-epimerase
MDILLTQSEDLSKVLYDHLERALLQKWYPLVIDQEYGGYFTNVQYDWSLAPQQDRMIVTQAGHMWATARAAAFVEHGESYATFARHGLLFLQSHFWDAQYGGFFQIRNREGGLSECEGWCEEKRTHGNAFAIYALAVVHRLTKDSSALDLAKKGFHWLEKHAYDQAHRGYFQFLTREGVPFDTNSRYTSVARDSSQVGLNDGNSCTRLLQAYTELYQVWKDDTLKRQLFALLQLIRDTMITEEGYLRLFYTRDWQPVSVTNHSRGLPHGYESFDDLCFGHALETAFLMLEASYVLGIENDARTLSIANRLLQQAIVNGWDSQVGGFYHTGRHCKGSHQCAVVKKNKTWWVQAEAFNTLLVFSRIFPHDTIYEELFEKQWNYIDKYLVDHDKGDWFEGGLDEEPHSVFAPKSHIWKCTYHVARALMNCIALLDETDEAQLGVRRHKAQLERFINHWKKT